MKLRRPSVVCSSLLAALFSVAACNAPASDTTKASADVVTASASTKTAKNEAPSAMQADVTPPPTASAALPAAPLDMTRIPPTHDGVLDPGVADTIVAKNGAPRVIVLDPGSEPRSELRYKLAENKHQGIGMTMKMEMTMEVGGKTMPIPMPAFGINMDLTTQDRDKATGDILVGAEVKQAKIVGERGDPKVAEAMTKAMGSMNGMKLTSYVSDEGRVRDTKVAMPPGADATGAQLVDQMKQSFTSMAQPLPHEPVGVGAKWLAITRTAAGADTLMYTTFHLKSRTGDKLDLETDVQQVVASADFPSPTGLTLHVSSFASHGAGKSVLDLTEVAPDHGDGDVELKMNASAQGQAVNIGTKINVIFGPPIP